MTELRDSMLQALFAKTHQDLEDDAFTAEVMVQVDRLKKKADLGARFALTQPCWSTERIAEIYESTRNVPATLYLGLMPFASERNCEFLHNEVPGMSVPDDVRERMKGLSGKKGREMGARIAEEMLDVIAQYSGRVYLITSFNHFDTTARLAEYFLERKRAQKRVEG